MYAPVWMVVEFGVVSISDGHWKVWMRLPTELEGASRHYTILSVFENLGGSEVPCWSVDIMFSSDLLQSLSSAQVPERRPLAPSRPERDINIVRNVQL